MSTPPPTIARIGAIEAATIASVLPRVSSASRESSRSGLRSVVLMVCSSAIWPDTPVILPVVLAAGSWVFANGSG